MGRCGMKCKGMDVVCMDYVGYGRVDGMGYDRMEWDGMGRCEMGRDGMYWGEWDKIL